MRILMITTQIKKKILIVFDDMMEDIITNEKLQAVVK